MISEEELKQQWLDSVFKEERFHDVGREVWLERQKPFLLGLDDRMNMETGNKEPLEVLMTCKRISDHVAASKEEIIAPSEVKATVSKLGLFAKPSEEQRQQLKQNVNPKSDDTIPPQTPQKK